MNETNNKFLFKCFYFVSDKKNIILCRLEKRKKKRRRSIAATPRTYLRNEKLNERKLKRKTFLIFSNKNTYNII